MKFTTGQIVATPGALEALQRHGRETLEFIARHVNGDWGDLLEDDAELNEVALMSGRASRLMSVYCLDDEDTIWIITEQDRSVTTILLPDEY